MKIRLGPVPHTENVKVTVVMPAVLKEKLVAYAKLHSEIWQEPVSSEQLIPLILDQFLLKDKAFKSALREQTRGPTGLHDSTLVKPHS